tara:strand:- start:9125 stop:10153 length:1029 start_codon:yes stop_codon:yes gene_type:complete
MKKIQNSYKKSGVNISVANKFVNHIAKITNKNVKKTNSSFSKENIGAFGSIFDISNIKIKDPLIVSSTDGVGTKLDLADKYKKFNTIGIDLVAMCVNDLIVQGAKPLFFLDYIAVGKLDLVKTKKILNGILKGCKISDCKLIGGETAEMPGIYSKDKFDLAGFSVGIVSKKKILGKNKVKKNDLIVAIPSSGLHSNGYSLLRMILKKYKLPVKHKNEILKPTKIYTKEILKLVNKNLVNAAAHITGGGLVENIVRSIPKKLSIDIDLSKIKTKKIFKWLKSKNISEVEMLNTFNCGIGFCIIINKGNFSKIKRYFSKNYEPYQIGYVSNKKKRINLINNIRW